jgi:hypothetical protein
MSELIKAALGVLTSFRGEVATWTNQGLLTSIDGHIAQIETAAEQDVRAGENAVHEVFSELYGAFHGHAAEAEPVEEAAPVETPAPVVEPAPVAPWQAPAEPVTAPAATDPTPAAPESPTTTEASATSSTPSNETSTSATPATDTPAV